ncbi:hypothetical protein FQA47_003910 [Oryzias melastigma]|uniref:Uncharacterized protein n=1 Tax=Oryzias melastigma TaxID=30732 RepID=A0A834C595_ORYME|nr:hypothetical protein FQA47_003910 [Oryzias melastigma]
MPLKMWAEPEIVSRIRANVSALAFGASVLHRFLDPIFPLRTRRLRLSAAFRTFRNVCVQRRSFPTKTKPQFGETFIFFLRSSSSSDLHHPQTFIIFFLRPSSSSSGLHLPQTFIIFFLRPSSSSSGLHLPESFISFLSPSSSSSDLHLPQTFNIFLRLSSPLCILHS